MQNKPNFRKAKMKLNFYSTKDYENQGRLRTPAKQTQSKPTAPVFIPKTHIPPKDHWKKYHKKLQFRQKSQWFQL
jgi:hypothetical protein